MSGHNQGYGTMLGNLGKRTLPAMLDNRRTAESDIRFVQYVSPFGPGLHRVKNVDNDQVYVVGSALGRTTFLPGQMVAAASNTGRPGEIIIGQPPPSMGGASAYGVKASVRDQPFTGDPEPGAPEPVERTLYSYHAAQTDDGFGGVGAECVACYRHTVSILGISGTTLVGATTAIANDSPFSAAIYLAPFPIGSDGRIVLTSQRAADNYRKIACWLPGSAPTASATYRNLACYPQVVGSTIYWVEFSGAHDFKLYSSAYSLSSLTLISTLTTTSTTYNGSMHPGGWISGGKFCFRTRGSGAGTQWFLNTMPLDGSTPAVSAQLVNLDDAKMTQTTGGGGGTVSGKGVIALSASGDSTYAPTRFPKLASNDDTALVELWPSTTGWTASGNALSRRVYVTGANYLTAFETASVFSGIATARGAVSGTSSGDPEFNVTIPACEAIPSAPLAASASVVHPFAAVVVL